MRQGYSLALLAALGGCGGGASYFPSKPGTRWTYSVQTVFRGQLEDVQVTRLLSVDGGEGFELAGQMGTSLFSWKDASTLVATQLGNERFEPAIPLLSLKVPKLSWEGKMKGLKGITDAKGTLEVTDEKKDFEGMVLPTKHSKVTLQSASHVVQLDTWFIADKGIRRQEQHTDGRQDLALDLVSGPN